MSNIILLGAGASYGSGDTIPYPPPLGGHLFKNLESLGGIASTLPEELKLVFIDNFEKGMLEFHNRYPSKTMQFQRELAGYLARFTPLDTNHYARLIKSINPHRVIYSSINYDLLFEISAAAQGLSTVYSNEKVKKTIRMLKIHGSSNFWPDLMGAQIRGSTFISNGEAEIEAGVQALNQKDTITRAVEEDSVAPAISLYAEGKQVRVCPSFVTVQQEMWRQSVKLAPKIFIVGVKINLIDSHIWDVISESKATIYYFGLHNDRHDFESWRENRKLKNCYFRESKFDESIGLMKKLM
ncbi:hypothetical protein [Raoultella sp. C349492]|uniref:hypothetical protein n=1 Tax=Raoultella sp. C349492 TaxID=2970253 RepID=UPI0035C695AC